MKWIIGSVIMLECSYQLFGIADSVNWSIYYELIKYVGFFAATLLLAYERWDKLLFHFSLFFLFLAGIQIPYIGVSRAEFITRSKSNDIHYIVFFAIFVLIIYIISKKWRRLKRVGK